jgi:O-antigen ligase
MERVGDARHRFGLGLISWGWLAVMAAVALWAVYQNRSAIPLIILPVAGAVAGFARFIQQYDRDFLIAFVREKVDAVEKSPPK